MSRKCWVITKSRSTGRGISGSLPGGRGLCPPTAVQENMAHEIRRNAERYRFLRWASTAFKNVHVNPPGTGIMHTINLEQLATVVSACDDGPVRWAVPDMMIGTDSHTPMVNGLGVLGWGVGAGSTNGNVGFAVGAAHTRGDRGTLARDVAPGRNGD